MAGAVLALNAGSSSIKFALYEVAGDGDLACLAKGEIDGTDSTPHFVVRDADRVLIGERRWAKTDKADFATLLRGLLDWVDSHLASDDLIGIGMERTIINTFLNDFFKFKNIWHQDSGHFIGQFCPFC